jgi:hypothetical protein
MAKSCADHHKQRAESIVRDDKDQAKSEDVQ